MKRHLPIMVSTAAICLLSAAIGHAEVVSTAIMSPNCTADQIKAIAGNAIVSIADNDSWDSEVKGFIITLDTDKLSYSDLISKMQEQGCFK